MLLLFSNPSEMPPKRAAKATKKEGSDVFDGKVFALSGTLTQTRDAITSLLEENGGTVASSVTKKVIILVIYYKLFAYILKKYLKVTHLITTAEDFSAGPSKVENAKVFPQAIV